jgi:hypothetical protein
MVGGKSEVGEIDFSGSPDVEFSGSLTMASWLRRRDSAALSAPSGRYFMFLDAPHTGRTREISRCVIG